MSHFVQSTIPNIYTTNSLKHVYLTGCPEEKCHLEGIEGHWASTKIEEKEIFHVSYDSLDMLKRHQKEPYTLFWGYPVYILLSHHRGHLRACVLNQCKQLTAVS